MDIDKGSSDAVVQPGTGVYGSDGEKVGNVIEADRDYLVVEKGLFFPTDYFVPVSAIATADGDRVTLTVSRDEALHQGWDRDPNADAAAEPGDRDNDAIEARPHDHAEREEDPPTAGMAAMLGTVPPAADLTLGVAAVDVDPDYTEVRRPETTDEVARDAAGEPERH